IFRIALQENLKPEPVMLITGRVINVATDKPVEANIVYETLEEGMKMGTAKSDPITGEFSIVLPKGVTYSFLAEAEGFIGINESIEVSDSIEYSEVRRDLKMVPLEVGQKVQL